MCGNFQVWNDRFVKYLTVLIPFPYITNDLFNFSKTVVWFELSCTLVVFMFTNNSHLNLFYLKLKYIQEVTSREWRVVFFPLTQLSWISHVCYFQFNSILNNGIRKWHWKRHFYTTKVKYPRLIYLKKKPSAFVGNARFLDFYDKFKIFENWGFGTFQINTPSWCSRNIIILKC